MYRPTMKPVSHRGVELESVHDARSGSPFGEPLANLWHPSSFGSRSIDAQVPEDIIMLRVPRLKQSLQGGGCLFGARDEAGFVSVELETRFSEG